MARSTPMHSSSSFWLGKGRQNQHHFSCVFGSLPSSHAPPSHLLFKLFCFSFHVESCDERKCHFVPSLQFADFIFLHISAPIHSYESTYRVCVSVSVCVCICVAAGAASTSRSTRERRSFRRSRPPTSSSTATRTSPPSAPAPRRRRPSTRATSLRPRPPCSAAPSMPLPRPWPLPSRPSRESQVTCRSPTVASTLFFSCVLLCSTKPPLSLLHSPPPVAPSVCCIRRAVSSGVPCMPTFRLHTLPAEPAEPPAGGSGSAVLKPRLSRGGTRVTACVSVAFFSNLKVIIFSLCRVPL